MTEAAARARGVAEGLELAAGIVEARGQLMRDAAKLSTGNWQDQRFCGHIVSLIAEDIRAALAALEEGR